MIDIHTHILPGVDDGIKTISEAVTIASWIYENEIDTIVATPHVLEPPTPDSMAKIFSAYEQLRTELSQNGIPLMVVLGAEVLIFPELARIVKKYPEITVGRTRKYILMELPFGEIPIYLETVIFELLAAGVTPIIAHPERYFSIQRDPDILVGLIKKGVIAQCNIGSISGEYGKSARKCLKTLIQCNAVHVFASDIHTLPPDNTHPLTKGINILQSQIDQAKAIDMVSNFPNKIIQGEKTDVPRPKDRKKRWFW